MITVVALVVCLNAPVDGTGTDEQLAAFQLEYEKLKEEQLMRISMRDNLVYATIATVGGGLFVSFEGDSSKLVLLLIPIITFALGWTYHSNDVKVTQLGRYLQQRSAALGDPIAHGWEQHHLEARGRRRRKALQLVTDLLIFPMAGLFCVALYVSSADWSAWSAVGVVVGVVLSGLLVAEMLRSSPWLERFLPAEV